MLQDPMFKAPFLTLKLGTFFKTGGRSPRAKVEGDCARAMASPGLGAQFGTPTMRDSALQHATNATG